MSDDPTEVLFEDSTALPPPHAQPVQPTLWPEPAQPLQPDKSSPERVAISLLLLVALIGGLIGGGIVALANRHNHDGTTVSFAPGSNLKFRNGALDIQG